MPVLSNSTVSTSARASRYKPPFTIAPRRAARPIAPRMARGVPAAMPQAPATMMTEIVDLRIVRDQKGQYSGSPMAK